MGVPPLLRQLEAEAEAKRAAVLAALERDQVFPYMHYLVFFFP